MKLLIDMNLSPAWAEFLSTAGIEAFHWSAIGPATAADSEIMAFAREHDLIVLTHVIWTSVPSSQRQEG